MIAAYGEARQDFSYNLRSKIQRVASNFASKSGWRSFNPQDFQIRHLRVNIPNLAPVFHNYLIVHISDIHYGQWVSSERLEGIITLINQNHPDAVAITGDFVSYLLNKSIEDELAAQLKKLQTKDGVFAVLGNHDHWAGAQRVKDILKKSNIIDLDNDIYEINREGFKLIFAGVDSVMMKKAQLDQVLEKIPPKDPAILLVHEPDFALTTASTKRFNLQLSGHSHGGQFYIPGLGTPFRDNYTLHYPHGLYNVGDMTLFTNTGLGTNSYWLRINCPPQIATINLV
ncbi:MAG: metallophosphoesterase [Nitrososphaerota archaeon]|jgi:predicted MPP superfamily phosphohydrolase|nr:metallophosphoesterase [Nitrososphaerota archaeon]